jgi:hypothetical protein
MRGSAPNPALLSGSPRGSVGLPSTRWASRAHRMAPVQTRSARPMATGHRTTRRTPQRAPDRRETHLKLLAEVSRCGACGEGESTLRLVCGVSSGDIARMFLVSEPTMAARMTRAKKKISTARIRYRVPGSAELPDRLRAVLAVIHLLFTTGHTAPSGASLVRTDLVDQALHLTRMLRDLMPDEREVWGLLALLLVTDARRATRVDADGRLLRLEEQDRSLWDQSAIAEAHAPGARDARAVQPHRQGPADHVTRW